MQFAFTQKEKQSTFKVLAGLSVNLSAAWLTVAFITPNFSPAMKLREIFLLFYDLIFAILFLWFSFELEKRIL